MSTPSSILQAMEDFVSEPGHCATIDQACDECEAELRTHPTLEMTYRVAIQEVNLTGSLVELRSLWVFAFAPGGVSDIHRHSNSTQYTRAWRGKGCMRVGGPEHSHDVVLPPELRVDFIKPQWTMIPRGVFHQGVATGDGWCVVSFQTVPAAELQDEPYEGEPHYYVSR